MSLISKLQKKMLITNEISQEYLSLRQYSDNDYRLYFGKKKRSGFDSNSSNKQTTLFDKSESERCSLSRSYHEIYDICRSNDWKFFVTITINQQNCNRYSLDDCQNLLLKNLKEYARRCTRYSLDFKYLFVTEQHLDGAYHFHGLINLFLIDDIIPNKNGFLTSKFFSSRIGFFSFSDIKSKSRVCSYVAKYVLKNPVRSSSSRTYFCSKGLKRSQVYHLRNDLQIPDHFWKFSNDYIRLSDFEFDKLDKNLQLILFDKTNYID